MNDNIFKHEGCFVSARLEDAGAEALLEGMFRQVDRYRTCFITAGRLDFQIGFEQFALHEGTLLFIPIGQTVTWPRKVGRVRGFAFSFTPDILIFQNHRRFLERFEFLQPLNTPSFELGLSDREDIRHIFNRLHKSYGNGQRYEAEIVNAYIMALFFELLRISKTIGKKDKAYVSVLTGRFKDLLARKILETQRVSDYARMLSISPNHLNKVIKADTGISPSVWVARTVLSEAKNMLSESDILISDIACRLGFIDASYFARFFKKHTGMKPTEFRKCE
jgi:AraC-type DNA-binding domain-containing proteins